MVFRSTLAITDIVLVVFLILLASGTSSFAQQTTGQLLISSGFNPIAATTPEMVSRLMSFPPTQFVLRKKGNRPYYLYADPSGCTCAYVGNVAAMDKYRASFGALPADTSFFRKTNWFGGNNIKRATISGVVAAMGLNPDDINNCPVVC